MLLFRSQNLGDIPRVAKWGRGYGGESRVGESEALREAKCREKRSVAKSGAKSVTVIDLIKELFISFFFRSIQPTSVVGCAATLFPLFALLRTYPENLDGVSCSLTNSAMIKFFKQKTLNAFQIIWLHPNESYRNDSGWSMVNAWGLNFWSWIWCNLSLLATLGPH